MNTQDQQPVEHFNSLLEWLDPNRERAAEKYRGIRQSLIKIFTWRGVADAESVADETLDRVMSRVDELRRTYKGDPSIYVYGEAKNVLIEQRRARGHDVELTDSVPSKQTTDIDEERRNGCLQRCLAELSPSSRTLIVDYYSRERTRTDRQSYREELARRLQIAPDALRVKVFRIRKNLETCLEACMKQNGTH
ncbi:MAG TPA: hypothetical protein VFR78_05765 [Pyrinomonadaceae bacterium]|nr:hypothetical protein [Pyrinomonadaceae bacterium]